MNNAISFCYFSGTGNTLLVVRRMQAVFEQAGCAVVLRPIESTNPASIDPSHTLGLAFPVAAQGTYPFVWDFVGRLPRVARTAVFMVDTLAGFSGGIVGPLRCMLSRKGYIPIGAAEIIMPNNFLPPWPHAARNEARIERGLAKAEVYAKALLAGTAMWNRVPFLSDCLSLVSRSDVTWKAMRAWYRIEVDQHACTKCGLCVRLCPVNNFAMADKVSVQNKCVLCMRCISFCPAKAIRSSRPHFFARRYWPHKAVSPNDLLP